MLPYIPYMDPMGYKVKFGPVGPIFSTTESCIPLMVSIFSGASPKTLGTSPKNHAKQNGFPQ